jgi:hypothetical protein
MPVGFNSPARNLFLLGSSGVDLVTNFFKRIDQSSTPYNNYTLSGIRYNDPDQKYILSGDRLELPVGVYEGWIEKRSSDGLLDWSKILRSTQPVQGISLAGMEIDNNQNIIVCGTEDNSFVAKFSNTGEYMWLIGSPIGYYNYTGISIDDSNDIYISANGYNFGAGNYELYVEKVSQTGEYLWGRSISTGDSESRLYRCSVNNRDEIVSVGYVDDLTKRKGYIVKMDTTTSEVLWERTIENPSIASLGSYWQTECTDLYIDNNDQIYVIGYSQDLVNNKFIGFIIKYTAEGNIIWQRETDRDEIIAYGSVKSDTETEQTIVAGVYIDSTTSDGHILLSKYSKDGSLIWRRKLYTDIITPFGSAVDYNIFNLELDADPSFYYLLFTDDNNQLGYVFGKVSTSGNGLGNFTYNDGVANVFYETLNITDNIGRFTDGSVRQDNSDLITYPFEANKILFDDLATQIANKKRQIDGGETYTNSPYSITVAYPQISTDRIVYGSNLKLNYDFKNKATYAGTGSTVYNLSRTSYSGAPFNGTISGATFNSAGYFSFPGTVDQRINVGSLSSYGYMNLTICVWFYPTSVTNYENVLDCNYNVADYDSIVKSGNIGPRLEMNNSGNLDWNWGASRSANDPFFTVDASNSNISPNIWYHAILVIDGSAASNGKSYLNGAFQSTGSGSGTSWTGGIENLVLGDGFVLSSSGEREFTGRIGEVQIYNRALTAAEVSQNFNATRAKYGV